MKRILLSASLLAGCAAETREPADEPTITVTGDDLQPTDQAAILDQAAQADVVFVGEVVSIAHQVSAPDAAGQRLPFTLVTWRISDPLKGVGDATYTARFLGGPLGDKVLEVTEIPVFAPGDRDLVFVRDNGSAGCPLVGGAHGRIRIGAKPDGLSRSAPSTRWLASAARMIRDGSAGAPIATAPDLAAPFVFEQPRRATRAQKLAAGARARAQRAAPAQPKTAEQLRYEANGHNPVLAR
jgi:hypothetical protein